MECLVSGSGTYVRALIGPGSAQRIAECYREIALLCSRHGVARAMVVSLEGDATDHFAMREAIRALAAAGVPPHFRLALSSENSGNFKVYTLGEASARRRNIDAKAFRDTGAALRWLEGRDD